MYLKIRKVFGFLSRLFPYKKAFCFRCGVTNLFAKFHFTLVSEQQISYCVLCDYCFKSLVPQERLYFYQKLIEFYHNNGVVYDQNTIEQIEKAVLSDK